MSVRSGTKGASRARLHKLVEEATVDAHDESEQRMGFYTMLEDNLALPFQTEVMGQTVRVESLSLNSSEEIVAICVRNGKQQVIGIVDLPLPRKKPTGAEWIEAYGYWKSGR